MANLSDVIDRLKAEGQLDRNTGTNSMKVQIGILKEINESLHVTGIAVKAIAAKITGEAVQDKQRAVQQGFEAQENTEKQIENNNKNTSTLRKGLDGVKTAVSGTFGFLKDMFKTGLLGAALPLLFGALGGPAAMAIGAMTGNPFLILIGAIGTLTEMLVAGDLMEILRDPDKSIGDRLAEIFYRGDDSLLGRIKKQVKEIYEELVPRETRDKLSALLDELIVAISYFKDIMRFVADQLGIGPEARANAVFAQVAPDLFREGEVPGTSEAPMTKAELLDLSNRLNIPLTEDELANLERVRGERVPQGLLRRILRRMNDEVADTIFETGGFLAPINLENLQEQNVGRRRLIFDRASQGDFAVRQRLQANLDRYTNDAIQEMQRNRESMSFSVNNGDYSQTGINFYSNPTEVVDRNSSVDLAQ